MSLVAFLTALLLTLFWFIRRPFALWAFFLALRPWWRLLSLAHSLWSLLPLLLGRRGTLLSRCLGGGPMNISAPNLRRLSARSR